jgi:hypothetical protein
MHEPIGLSAVRASVRFDCAAPLRGARRMQSAPNDSLQKPEFLCVSVALWLETICDLSHRRVEAA